MASAKMEVLMSTIINQIPDLDAGELVMVADFIKGLKLARKFRK